MQLCLDSRLPLLTLNRFGIRFGECLNLRGWTIVTLRASRLSEALLDACCRPPSGLDGAQRETQPGANLQKTLPACLIMRMTCSSIPRLRVRGATVFLWSYDTFTYCVFSASIFYCTLQVWKWYSDVSDKIYEMTECIIFTISATLWLIANLQFSHCQHFPPHLLHFIGTKIKIKQPWVTANAVNKQSTLHTVHWPY